MNAVDESIRTMHAKVDAFFERLRVNQPQDFNPPCKVNCFWCCYEPLYTDEAETDYALKSLTDDQIEALKPVLRTWLDKAKEQLVRPYNDKIAIAYRAANIPCPLLVDGKCSVYDRRPVGCRSHFALSHPENCAMPMRKHQKYAMFPHPNPLDVYLAEYAIQAGKTHMDHFGVHLANKVLGLKLRSAAHEVFDIKAELSQV